MRLESEPLEREGGELMAPEFDLRTPTTPISDSTADQFFSVTLNAETLSAIRVYVWDTPPPPQRQRSRNPFTSRDPSHQRADRRRVRK